MPIVLETCGQTGKHCFHNKFVSDFIGKHFCFPGGKFFAGPHFSLAPGKNYAHSKSGLRLLRSLVTLH
jgi:hypothetical protein